VAIARRFRKRQPAAGLEPVLATKRKNLLALAAFRVLYLRDPN
jgi:hypothetical protein